MFNKRDRNEVRRIRHERVRKKDQRDAHPPPVVRLSQQRATSTPR